MAGKAGWERNEAGGRGIGWFAVLCDDAFRAGFEDKLAGRPLSEYPDFSGVLLYEYGRLFATFCQAAGVPVPALPRRGQRRAPYEDVRLLLYRAFTEGVFPT